MNWIREIIYFNEVTDFIMWSKLYINICLYKFLGNIVQKNYIIYKYIFRLVPLKNIQLSIHVRMNEYDHITTTINALCQEPVNVFRPVLPQAKRLW